MMMNPKRPKRAKNQKSPKTHRSRNREVQLLTLLDVRIHHSSLDDADTLTVACCCRNQRTATRATPRRAVLFHTIDRVVVVVELLVGADFCRTMAMTMSTILGARLGSRSIELMRHVAHCGWAGQRSKQQTTSSRTLLVLKVVAALRVSSQTTTATTTVEQPST